MVLKTQTGVGIERQEQEKEGLGEKVIFELNLKGERMQKKAQNLEKKSHSIFYLLWFLTFSLKPSNNSIILGLVRLSNLLEITKHISGRASI